MGNRDRGKPLPKHEPLSFGFLFAMERADAARGGLPAGENPYSMCSGQSSTFWLEGWIQNALTAGGLLKNCGLSGVAQAARAHPSDVGPRSAGRCRGCASRQAHRTFSQRRPSGRGSETGAQTPDSAGEGEAMWAKLRVEASVANIAAAVRIFVRSLGKHPGPRAEAPQKVGRRMVHA
jgi:hypothetical protein